MSNSRQSPPKGEAEGERELDLEDPEDGVLVRSYAVTHPPGLHLRERVHQDWHQLVFAVAGVMSVHTAEGVWVVPPERAVWIPAGASHAVRMGGRVTLRSLFFRRSGRPPVSVRCRTVGVSPLLRELVLTVCAQGVLQARVAQDARLAAVVLDQLQALPDAALELPLPVEPRARQLAEAILRQPAASLDELIAPVAASRRTLERLFRSQTGIALGRWRQRARLVYALERLARCEPAGAVAMAAGYASPSAFTAAFRRNLGRPPTRYFRY
jgi:AraC-like DNA-binding protein/quercetin dioxygenase-like cupin family protein